MAKESREKLTDKEIKNLGLRPEVSDGVCFPGLRRFMERTARKWGKR